MKYNQPYGNPNENAGYIDGNPALGIEGSPVPAAAVEFTQRELVEIITAAGFTPSNDDLKQLLKALPLRRNGIMPHDAVTSYVKNALVMGGDGYIYQALLPSGPDNGGVKDPTDTANAAYWINYLSLPLSYLTTFVGTDLLVSALQFIPGRWYLFSGTNPNVPIKETINCLARVIEKTTGGDFLLEAIGVDGIETYRNRYAGAAWRGWRRVDNGGAFPSNQSLLLAVPASGATAISPGTGWLQFIMRPSITNGSIMFLKANNVSFYYSGGTAGSPWHMSIPISKGDTYTVQYNGNPTDMSLTLLYSKGAI